MKILVLSPHPDDAELYAGGTIAKLRRQGGCDIHWVSFSDCENDEIEYEWNKSMDIFEPIQRHFWNFPRRGFDRHRQRILDELINIRNINPKFDYVFSTHPQDVHQDHAVIGQEAIRAFKNTNLLFYLQPSNLNNLNVKVFSEITKYDLGTKWEAINCYKSQFDMERPYFDIDYIKALAKVYGTMINKPYAEGFDSFRMFM